MKKTGRNDPCPCGSGKKLKKCCESLPFSGGFKIDKITSESAPQIQKTAGLTSFFQAHLAATPKKSLPPEPIVDVIVDLEKKEEDLIV